MYNCCLQNANTPRLPANSLVHLYRRHLYKLQMCTNCDSHLWTSEVKTYTATLRNAFLQSHKYLQHLRLAVPVRDCNSSILWDQWLMTFLFEFISIAIWEYFIFFVLCKIMEHFLVPTMALLRKGIQPVSTQSLIHVFLCCNVKSSVFFLKRTIFFFFENAHFSHPTCIHEGCT